MNGVHINTSQNVSIDYELADIGQRIAARLLDSIFMGAYLLIIFFILMGIVFNQDNYSGDEDIILIIIWSIAMIPVFFYSLYFPYFMQGKTPGKAIMKLKIVKVDGSEAGFGTYLVRWLLNVIDILFDYIVGVIVMVSSKKRQRVADMVANTVVISTRQKIQAEETVLYHIDDSDNYQPKFTQVLQLSDKDVQIIRKTLAKARETMNYHIVQELREKIETVIHEYKPEMTDTEYIETILKDYQYFSQQ